jgi:peptidoglycan/LPS O-acetylase OafA/YrhL
MKPNTEPGAYLALDGMRGIGAILVVIGHCYIFWAGYRLPNGFPVVDMFFLLSGFVIAFAYEAKFRAGMSAGKFLLQRVVRLYPLYFLGLMMGALVRLAMVADRGPEAAGEYFGQLIPQLFILPSPDLAGTGTLYQFNGPAWTLFYEFVANAVYILCWRWLKSTRVLAIVVGLSGLWLATATLAGGNFDMGPTWHDFWGGFSRAAFSFFGGVLLFRFVGSPRTVKVRITLWAVAPALLLPIIVMPDLSKEMSLWLALFTVMIVSPLVIWWASRMNPPRWLWKTFAMLGSMSYAMYILHYPIFLAMQRISWRFPELSSVWAPWSGIAILAVVFVVALAAERFYDVPVRAWINAKLKARKKLKQFTQPAHMDAAA